MNNETFLIENSCLEQAQSICKLISNDECKNRAIANAFAAVIAKNYFEEIEVDIESGLYKNPAFLEKLEISDIYIKNNYIDVRIYFNENELCVPKSHFDNEMTPVAYMFIKIDDELTNGFVTGFILPENINTSREFNGYYKVDENELISYYDIEPLLIEKEENVDINDNFDLRMHEYIDGNLSDTKSFYQELLASKYAREKFYNLTNAKFVFEYVSINNTKIETETNVEEKNEEDLSFTKVDTEVDTESNIEKSDLFNEELVEITEEDEDSLELTAYDNSDLELTEPLEENIKIEEEVLEGDELLITEDIDNSTFSDLNEVDDSGLDLDVDIETNDLSESLELEIQDNELETELEPDIQEDNENLLIEATENDDLIFDDNESISLQESDLETISEENLENSIDSQIENLTDITDQGDKDLTSTTQLDEDLAGDISLNNSFDYSTTTTPSMNSLENEISNEITSETDDNLILDTTEEKEIIASDDVAENVETLNFEADETLETETVEESPEDKIIYSNEDKNAELEALFSDDIETDNDSTTKDPISNEYDNNEENSINIESVKTKNSSKLLPLLGAIILVSSIGYWGYNKFYLQNDETNYNAPVVPITQANTPIVNKTLPEPQKITKEPMPIETVENTKKINNKNEGTAINIPAIEQNLDASILISNLSIEWEVPLAYTTNNTAKRYLTKMGKIIQLNLKSELLLLNTPPLTNKIIVELAYNASSNKFETKGFVKSSGVKNVDEVIKRTIKNALDINLNMNMSSFNNLSGNPTLIIRL